MSGRGCDVFPCNINLNIMLVSRIKYLNMRERGGSILLEKNILNVQCPISNLRTTSVSFDYAYFYQNHCELKVPAHLNPTKGSGPDSD